MSRLVPIKALASQNGCLALADLDPDQKEQPGRAKRQLHPRRLIELPPPAPIHHLVSPVLVGNEVNAIVGEGGAYKSTCLIALAGAIACGAHAFGELPVRAGTILYVSGEDAAE